MTRVMPANGGNLPDALDEVPAASYTDGAGRVQPLAGFVDSSSITIDPVIACSRLQRRMLMSIPRRDLCGLGNSCDRRI